MKANNFDEAKIEIEELEEQLTSMKEEMSKITKERDDLKDENLRTFRKLLGGTHTAIEKDEKTISVSDFEFPIIR